MSSFSFALLFALQQVAAPVAAPGEAPEVVIPRIEDAVVVVDGVLDEEVWSRAARLDGFWQYEPVDGRPAEERTEVLVWYAPDAIHFGIIAHDSQPGSIRAALSERDAIGSDDNVTIFLDTFNDRRRAFFFGVNPLGVQADGVRTEGGNSDDSPDYLFESRGRLTERGYVVEVRIPFKSLRFPPEREQRWGLQIQRRVQRTGYVDTWTATRKASASFLAQAGTISGLRDLERGVVFEAQPFLTASANGARAADGSFSREPFDPEVGLNVHVGFSSIAIDATLNPDFSQVEADAGQVTANERFALFYAEKRPFFLEGKELFETPGRLVHTRQIANPIAGGKVTGKVGGIGIAHLTALDDVSGGDDALFNVTRLRRDFGAGSVAGLTYTDRSVRGGDDTNRVLAADVRHVFGRMYFLQAQYGHAWTRDESGERDAAIWSLELDRTGRLFGFNYKLGGVGEDFVSRTGYVPRTGYVEGQLFNRLAFYGAEGALVEHINIVSIPRRIWRSDGFGKDDAIEGGESLSATFRLRGGWEVRAEGQRWFYELDPDAYAAYEVETENGLIPYQALDRVSGPGLSLRVETPAFRTFNASASLGRAREPIFAEGAEGNVTEASGSISLRPDPSVRLNVSTTFQEIRRTRDNSRFARTIIPRVRAEYQPTRALFFRVIGEYQSAREAALVDARTGRPLLRDGTPVASKRTESLRLDLLASYEPAPGTVAYFGYGGTLFGEDTWNFREMRRANDGFFLKLAYRWRR